MKSKQKLIWLQIVLGTVFLIQPIILPVRPDHIETKFFSIDIIRNIIANALILIFFYFNYFVLIPKLYFRKKTVQYFSIILIVLIGILIVTSSITFRPPNKQLIGFRPPLGEKPKKGLQYPPPQPFDFNQNSVVSKFQFFFTENDQTFFLFGAIVLFSLLLKVSNRNYILENAKQKAEMNYLLAQINPHFMFNALNSIYTLTIREKASNSSISLLKLSGLMRYLITEINQDRVRLEKEILCINDFIDLQRLRLTENVNLSYEVKGNSADKQIAPMLLIPFVENAFKHGVSPDENSEIEIKIEIIESELVLVVKNNKVSISKLTLEKSGLGVANAKNRLELIYPNKYKLIVTETDKVYCTKLKIFF
ncbi:MAG: histidine kinase [Bacteroidia bacterium]|nr:histidine kinase [Bacteroidia bacterium]